MNKFIEWDSLDFRKSSGKEKLRCPSCDANRSDKKDKSLLINHSDGFGKCFYCDSLTFRDSKKIKRNVTYKLPEQTWRNHTKLSDNLIKWVEDERKIRQSTLIDLGITEEKYYQPAMQTEANNLVFNYFEGETLVNKKYRSGSKNFTQSAGTKSIFYNINSVIGQEEVYIVEGEFDVLAMHNEGYKNVISVPNGANDNDEYWKNSEKYLKNVEKFIIATDNDEKGNELKDHIAQRLGRYRCEYIEWKNKDANGDLISGDFKESIKERKRFPVSGTFKISDLKDGIFELYNHGLPKTIYPKNECFGELKNIYSGMRGHLAVITGIPSHGKALDINTPIPSPSGFINLGELKIGDKVFDENGDECSVKWKSEIWSDRPTYKITFSDNSTIIADENHEWLTDTWKSRRSESNHKRRGCPSGHFNEQTHKRTFATVKTTKKILDSLKTKSDNRNNHSVKLCKPLNIQSSNLLINPYVLGCWLGDGTSSDGGFSSNDIEIVDKLREHYIVTKRKSKYSYGIIGIKKQLKELNLINNKHIPSSYIFSSEEQRLELLRGLMDTDGHCSIVEARNEYCGINKELCEGVYSLVCSLGIKATFVEGDAMLDGKFISKKYRVFFKTNQDVFKLQRKQNVINDYFKTRKTRGNDIRYITNIEEVSGYKTQCIEVDSNSHLFLAGNQFIPTHNSNYAEWYVLNLIHDYKMKASFFSPEHSPMELHQTNFIQKAVGKNFWKAQGLQSRITEKDIERYIEWADEKIYITNPEKGQFPSWDWILEKFKEQMFNFGIDIFVIDAFNKLELPKGNKIDAINTIMTKLTMFAQMNNVMIFLVVHPTKMTKKEDGTYSIPSLYDCSGSADFRNQTHDGFTIYRYFPTQEDPEGKTSFINLKTKFSYQGEIGKSVDFNYDVLTGRYYAVGESVPSFDMTRPDEEQVQMMPNLSFDDTEEDMPF